MESKKDRIYSTPQETVADFVFDEKVAAVFDDMLNRSVPGYKTIIQMISVLAKQYAQPQSVIYDLGCSHGPLTALLKAKIHQLDCCVKAVDTSAPLLAQCKENLTLIPHGLPVEFINEDICQLDFSNASVVVMNFILQFIDPSLKRDLLQKIFNGLKNNGALILSEKIRCLESYENDFQVRHHHLYKADQGYSSLEIEQKAKSLENVLFMNTIDEHRKQLQAIGFSDVYLWYQCFNFVSFIAIKK